MSWGRPELLWLLLVVPALVLAYAFDGQRRQRLLARVGDATMLGKMIATASVARRRWRAVLTVAATACLVASLGRPQIPGRARLTQSRGLDLVVALDFSRSMSARDVYPSRLERAKAELGRLLDGLKGDRVGLVAFAGETLSYPLTVDYEAAKLFWRDLGVDDMPVGGTDLGRAITAASELLTRVRRKEARRRPAQVILLITDGEDTEGKGLQAARAAGKQGIKIFPVGIGSNERPYVQTFDELGKARGFLLDESGQPVRVGLDVAGLRQIAAASGGEFVPVDPQRFGVERVAATLAQLERTEEEARLEREPEDVGRWFLLPAYVLLLIEACMRERRRERGRRRVAPAQPEAAAPGDRGRSTRSLQAALVLCLPLLTGFDLFLRRDPNVEKGNQLLSQGKAAEALEAYDRAAQALPADPIVRFDRGAALYQLGRYPEAQREFQRAAEGRDPQLKADAHYNLGNALFQQERWKDALEAYKRSLSLRPEDRRAKWNFELALRRLRAQQQQQQQQQPGNQDQPQEKGDQRQQTPQGQQQGEQQARPEQDQGEQQEQQRQGQAQPKQGDEAQPKQGDRPRQEESSRKAPEPEGSKGASARKQGREPTREPAPAREIDRQDAAAVLDALERVEPTVQKDLARRRAASRRPKKDW